VLREEEAVDLIVAPTHMRVPNDIQLGSQVPKMDIVLDGHDHHYEVTPSDPHGTLVVKSVTDLTELTLLKVTLGHYTPRRAALRLTRPRFYVCSCVVCEQVCLPHSHCASSFMQ
jgi:2',3'-cyclic-nucleotide 2'-phosphodiesterase (5'-nucleotidase family)